MASGDIEELLKVCNSHNLNDVDDPLTQSVQTLTKAQLTKWLVENKLKVPSTKSVKTGESWGTLRHLAFILPSIVFIAAVLAAPHPPTTAADVVAMVRLPFSLCR
jgi:hypothetical protein